jgi:uncharacterized protein YndB with AHSA1/START domain
MDARRNSPAAESMDRPFVISRSFDAPRKLVFEVWTKPEHLKQWFSPKGFTVLAAKMDFRPGGVYHYGMRGPDGKDMWGRWVFREIVAPERIVFINSFSDESGALARPPFPDPWPVEMLSTITFAESGGRTTVTITWVPHDSTEAERKTFDAGRVSMQQGWGGTLDQLAAYLATRGVQS